jgi:hypothetical protein
VTLPDSPGAVYDDENLEDLVPGAPEPPADAPDDADADDDGS